MSLASKGGWAEGGGKVWGNGAGVEVVNGGNAAYYDQGMNAAKAYCPTAGCALVVNPPGHRTVNTFHIHHIHFASYGRSLKSRLEAKTCTALGRWQSGGFPCGGKAIFVSGWPKVFNVAMSGGSISHASVIAWPMACGGRGTIVELAFGCSIEHQIRGDFNPSRR